MYTTALEFGLTLTGLGVLLMFSALAVVIITCEILKRIFMETEARPTPTETVQREKRAHEVG